MERITIKNFGPIKNMILDLDMQYNVLIGAQGTGKSTAVKCATFFSDLSSCFSEFFIKNIRRNVEYCTNDLLLLLHKTIREKFINSFSKEFMNDDMEIQCDYGNDIKVIVKLVDKNLLTTISNELERRLRKAFENNQPGQVRECDDVMYDAVTIRTWGESIKKILDEKELYYIPAGRNTIASMINLNVFTKEAVGSSDFALANYLMRVMTCKNNWNDFGKWGFGKPFCDEVTENQIKDRIKTFDLISKKILKGKYRQNRKEDYIAIAGGKYIPVTFASSGQQEVLWIINLLKFILVEKIMATIIVEEPEAHLYPDAQFELIKLVTLVANYTDSKVIITTHSPYILSAFNLLLHSGYVENNKILQNAEKRGVISKEHRIAPGTLVAKKIDDKGEVINLISGARSMIDIFAIDGISDKINEYTDRLIAKEIKHGL